MQLPTIESIKMTIENHHDTNIHDASLIGYHPLPGLLGPMFYPGGFGVVFPLQNSTGHKYAFRVWHKEIAGIKERTNKIATYLQGLNLPYFVEFDFVSGGLTVEEEDGEQTVDTVRMDWVEGDNLHDFISNAKKDESVDVFKSTMRTLAANFKKMYKDLHRVEISHGDLQHGNVVIQDDLSIKLVDYDSVYVPTIQGEQQITSGLTGYQHPLRKIRSDTAAPYDDYFSELIIYSGLLILSIMPELWPDDEDELDNFSFLFTENDFNNIICDTKNIGLLSESNLNIIQSCDTFRKLINKQFTDPDDIATAETVKELLVQLVNYLNASDLSTLKPIRGTEKLEKKVIYEPLIDSGNGIDVIELKKILGSLGGKSTKNSYTGTQAVQVRITKTDKDTIKDKYRNQ